MKLNGDLKSGAALGLFIAALSLTGLAWTPYGYNQMDPASRFLSPCGAHLLGTDNFGRDVFSRTLAGGRYTLLVALVTVAGSAALGAALGLVSGYAGGTPDELLMRLMDALSSFPGILLALVMVSLLGNSQGTLVIALLVLFIPGFARLMRNGMLEYKGRDFVKAAEIQGVSHGRIIFAHILPNLTPSMLSASALGLSNAVLAEAAIQKADERLNFVTKDKDFLRNYHPRQMEMSDWTTGINTAFEKGVISVAKNALAEGASIDFIKKITGLTAHNRSVHAAPSALFVRLGTMPCL